MKVHNAMKAEDNRTVWNRLQRQLFNCSYCKPNRTENGGKWEYGNYGPKKPRHKDHR